MMVRDQGSRGAEGALTLGRGIVKGAVPDEGSGRTAGSVAFVELRSAWASSQYKNRVDCPSKLPV